MIYPPALRIPPAERWRLDDCDQNQVLFIGRFDRHKGGDLIIEAFGRVLQGVLQARLSFRGARFRLHRRGGRRWDPRRIRSRSAPRCTRVGTGRTTGPATVFGPGHPASKADGDHGLLAVRERSACLDRGHVPGLSDRRGEGGGYPRSCKIRADGLLHCPEDPDDLAAGRPFVQ